jgi:hypothetical protein
MASNFQRGPVKLDAGDWTRLKRLRGSSNFLSVIANNTDITNPITTLPNAVVDSSRITEFGTSRIRRSASTFTDFKGWSTSDYPQKFKLDTGPSFIAITRLCNCAILTFYNKRGVCSGCMSNSITKVKG